MKKSTQNWLTSVVISLALALMICSCTDDFKRDPVVTHPNQVEGYIIMHKEIYNSKYITYDVYNSADSSFVKIRMYKCFNYNVLDTIHSSRITLEIVH